MRDDYVSSNLTTVSFLIVVHRHIYWHKRITEFCPQPHPRTCMQINIFQRPIYFLLVTMADYLIYCSKNCEYQKQRWWPYLYPDVVCTRTMRDLFSIIGLSCLLSASNNNWRWNWSWSMQHKSLIKRENIITMAISTTLNKIKFQAYQ